MINRVGKVKPSFTIVYIISLNVSMTDVEGSSH